MYVLISVSTVFPLFLGVPDISSSTGRHLWHCHAVFTCVSCYKNTSAIHRNLCSIHRMRVQGRSAQPAHRNTCMYFFAKMLKYIKHFVRDFPIVMVSSHCLDQFVVLQIKTKLYL